MTYVESQNGQTYDRWLGSVATSAPHVWHWKCFEGTFKVPGSKFKVGGKPGTWNLELGISMPQAGQNLSSGSTGVPQASHGAPEGETTSASTGGASRN
jgi:hypothetical protein